jgi:hypothetical protein
MRDGKKANTAATFDRRAAADAWITRKETGVAKLGGLEPLSRTWSNGVTLGDAVDRDIIESVKEMRAPRRRS